MSIIVNGKLVKNTKYSGIKTTVRSIRAEKSFWEKCNTIAKKEGITCNELIVRVVSEYCDKTINRFENGGIPKSGEFLFHGDNEPEIVIDGKKFKQYSNAYTYIKEPKKHIEESIYEICKKQFEKENGMLKIKDNVDLKELEKFGFMKSNEIIKGYYKGNHTFDMCIIVMEDKTITLRAFNFGDNKYFDDFQIAEWLYDLIKADLVERC